MESVLALGATILSALCAGFLVSWVTDPIHRVRARSFGPDHLKERMVTLVKTISSSRRVEALVDALGSEEELARVVRTLPRKYAFTSGDAVVMIAGTCLAIGVVCLLVTGSFAGFVCGFIFGVMPWYVLVTRHEERESRALSESMPEVFRSLSVALGAGKSVQQACRYVGERMLGVVGQEFSRASYRMEMGTPALESIEELEMSIPAPGMKLLGSALMISQKTGCALKGLFDKAGRAVERSAELERELKVKTSQAQLSAKIVSGLPVVLLLGIALISPDFREGLLTPLGAGCVVVGLLLDGFGLLVIRSILRVEV